MAALGEFFGRQPFGRFAVTMTSKTKLPDGIRQIQVMPGLLRRRWQELTPRFQPLPVEVAFIHEASNRGDELLERYFGESVVVIDGKPVTAHHAIMSKGDEASRWPTSSFKRPAAKRGTGSTLAAQSGATSRWSFAQIPCGRASLP